MQHFKVCKVGNVHFLIWPCEVSAKLPHLKNKTTKTLFGIYFILPSLSFPDVPFLLPSPRRQSLLQKIKEKRLKKT